VRHVSCGQSHTAVLTQVYIPLDIYLYCGITLLLGMMDMQCYLKIIGFTPQFVCIRFICSDWLFHSVKSDFRSFYQYWTCI